MVQPSTATGPTIVGIDGSPQSNAALLWAVEHTPTGQAIHVVHAFPPSEELALAAAQQDWTVQRDRRARALGDAWTAEARAQGADLVTSIVDDGPADALIGKARACDAAMIVIGPHGGGRARSLGSVARALLHELPVPVVIARPKVDPVPIEPRVLVGVGYGDTVDPAVMWAAEHANRFGCALELLHVVGHRPVVPLDSPADMLASYLGGSTSVDWASDDLSGLAEAVRENIGELEVRTTVKRGSVVRQTLARAEGASIIVLGQSRMERVTRNLYASRTLGIVSGASCSVSVVPA